MAHSVSPSATVCCRAAGRDAPLRALDPLVPDPLVPDAAGRVLPEAAGRVGADADPAAGRVSPEPEERVAEEPAERVPVDDDPEAAAVRLSSDVLDADEARGMRSVLPG